MKAALLPVVMLLAGSGAGIGAGMFLQPPPPDAGSEDAEAAVDKAPETQPAVTVPVDVSTEREFVKLNNQFIIPVLDDGFVSALVVMSLNLEVTLGSRASIFAAEPKLRDRFLQVMFDHANTGGFSGNFTTGTNMRILRNDLLRVAQQISGDRITDVLILDIVRQDS